VNKKRIAFPEATEEKILLAAREALDKGAILPVLVGDIDTIEEAAITFRVSLGGMDLVSNTDVDDVQRKADIYVVDYPILGAKSIVRKCRDPMYYAFVLEALGQVDAVFTGLTYTTADVILAASTIIGLAPGISVVSSMGLMDIPGYEGENGSLLAFSDAAVNVDPSDAELADIAITTSDTIRTLMDWEPKCALLSFSTAGSADHEKAGKVRRAVEIANKKRPDLAIDGEFQLDAAIVPATAAKKVKRESKVAGHANIIIYPEINAGNIGVKLVQQFAHGDAYGPMLQGFAKPVSDCSRGAPVSELVGNIIMLAVCAQNKK
jgi:phosphate acetyltransferase